MLSLHNTLAVWVGQQLVHSLVPKDIQREGTAQPDPAGLLPLEAAEAALQLGKGSLGAVLRVSTSPEPCITVPRLSMVWMGGGPVMVEPSALSCHRAVLCCLLQERPQPHAGSAHKWEVSSQFTQSKLELAAGWGPHTAQGLP